MSHDEGKMRVCWVRERSTEVAAALLRKQAVHLYSFPRMVRDDMGGDCPPLSWEQKHRNPVRRSSPFQIGDSPL